MLIFLVEYLVPNAGQLSAIELQAISQQWRGVLNEMGPGIELIAGYVTEHQIYAIYIAVDPVLLSEHARLAGLPAQRITNVKAVIKPAASP